MKKYLLYFYLILTGGSSLFAQSNSDELYKLIRDDSIDVNTISLYPVSVRNHIFNAALYPEGIAKLGDIQQKSNEDFKRTVSELSKEEQQKIWNLTRYKGLIASLAGTGGKKKRVESVLKEYPAEIHEDANNFTTKKFSLIVALNNINTKFISDFHSIITSYPEEVQVAFRGLLETPEALSILIDNMHLAVHLGGLYRSSPGLLTHVMDSLNTVNAEQQAKDAEQWKKTMNENSAARDEFKETTAAYAKENGYSEKDYSNSPEVVNNYIWLSYPFWSGYPWWYEHHFWYPYPVWYHWGFYFWNGEMVWIGPPSWYFVHWHFNYHPHFYHYPHLTNVFIDRYYYAPRRGISRNSAEVRRWMRDNEKSFPADFRSNQNERIERIREFGKSEVDRDRFNQDHPENKLSRDEYMKQRSDEYPHLKNIVVKEPEDSRKSDTKPAGEMKNEVPRTDDKKDDVKPEKSRDNERVVPSRENKKPVKISEPVKPKKTESRPTPQRDPVIVPKEVPSRTLPKPDSKTQPEEKRPSRQEKRK